MEIGNPVWKAREHTYVFSLRSVPSEFVLQESSYIESGEFPDIRPTIFVKSVVNALVEDIVEKTKSKFATPLTGVHVLSRLTHIWEHSKGPAVQESGWYTVTWTPLEFSVKPKDFVIVWYPSNVIPAEARIPSDFVSMPTPRSQSPAPEVRTIQIQPSTSGLVEYDLPLADSEEPRFPVESFESSALDSEKKRIREARLRAALAQLKAERLAEKYYKKYGILPGDDSSEEDSEDESETE